VLREGASWRIYAVRGSPSVPSKLQVMSSPKHVRSSFRKPQNPQERIAVIPDWDRSTESFHSQSITLGGIEQNIPKNLCCHVRGTLGYVSGVEILVEVARLLRDRRNLLIVCIGEGVRKRQMIEQRRSLGL